ncbi:alpha/beta fold hydrolase [Cytobacillus purgationiresistens]|uniref:Pimeloyl-ACP methyl ester carboxylesterase n=1 Tax=Cytobacillus purgationiresistens TaxID=863449 RepID=A0ABU0AAX2_9BACI|nr:alpha/beta hydrolase [Cytobacillus purgationiresistens]MDQ0268170.1 pimeloyl-ACP methyl ester carboxylesterase [Cytobacillus purgationiresistens]
MSLQYKESGDSNSRLIVFIHGGGVGGWMWDEQVEYFSRFHCLVPDLPEHGESISSKPFKIKSTAEEIIELVEEKGKGKTVIVIGFSLGAQVLIAMLSIKPDLIHYAMINSALVKHMPFADTLTKSMAWFYPLTKNKTFSNIQAKSMYIDQHYYETYYLGNCQFGKDAFLRVMKENMAFRIPRRFEHASGQILVTVGEKERKIMKESAREIIQSNPNCKGFIISKMGHGLSLANPILFNTIVETWLGNGTFPQELQAIK